MVRLCNREGEYVDVKPYRAYKLTSTPKFLDPTIALDYIEMDEDDVKPILTTYELQKLHIMNNGSSGYVEKHSMRWVTRCTIPRMQCPQVKKLKR